MRVAAFVFAFVPALLTAQAAERPIRLVVSGGLQVPTGTFADYHDMGAHADVSVLLNIAGFRLRPELSYSRFNLKDDFDLPALFGRSGNGAAGGYRRDAYDDAISSLLGGFANIELPLGRGAFQPFLLGGVGAVNVNTEATTAATAVKELKASLNVGAGVRFRMGPISGLVEARVNNVPSDDAKAFFKDLRTIPVTFGLVF